MRVLSRVEVFKAIEHAKQFNEEQGRYILEQFSQQQPAMQQMLFVGLSQAVNVINKQLSPLFMDLCFEIICVYGQILGDMPKNIATPHWIHANMAAIEEEVKQQSPSTPTKIKIPDYAQVELLEYVGIVIDDFAGKSKARQEAGNATYNLLYLVTRLFDRVYDEGEKRTVH